jgi:phage protein D
MADSTPYATVKIEGIDMKSQVQSIDVEDHDRAIDRARVVFDSADDVSKITREQSKVQISLGWSDANALIFEGIVMGVKTEATGTGQARVTVTAYDLSYKMKQNQTKDRYFISGKLSDALKTIVADYSDLGVGQIQIDPDPDLTPAKAWGKTKGQSDWDFIQAAAITYKARAFVEVNDNQSQFYFVSEQSLLKGDPMGVLHYCPGGIGPLLEFKCERVGSGASPQSTATVIDPKTGDPVTQQAPPPADEPPLEVDPDADATLAQAGGIMAQAAGQPADARPKTNLAGLPSNPDEAQQAVQQDLTRVLGYSGRGVCRGTIMLRAKGKVTIMGLPPWIEGDWYVHKVNHVYTRIATLDKDAKTVDRSTYQTKFSVTR